ncbi:patatin-like phospholipase family protein [Cryobacterium tepidiphilum]|uniref:Patatin-like phospholipase family protein n=1 Tax=Cryobacterium tepidiphilum TaxID=2486026 RepID=A0A3M8L9K0_9MICO|nr:patatin-like phospholipase family protein [Cryobacterium tepidiphilum]RNE62116.1 patatin-like phospholipase family protein [Cryobacterium tepidiphilum]
MNTTFSSRPNGGPDKRALVLAGAGAAGNAWEIGLIAGLCEAGLDVTRADLIIGTSAGSTVAAQVTSGTRPADLYAAILAEVPPLRASDAGPQARRAPHPSGHTYMEWSNGIIGSAEDASDMRRRMGAAALETDASNGSGPSRWRDVVAARLPSQHWPQQPVLITAVDARSGEPVVFDSHSGIDLVDAVAASTSNGFGGAYRIGDHRYINGGYRRSENADLAAGCGRVLVLSPFGGRSRMPLEWGMDLATQVAELRAGGSRVETVFPDDGAGDVFNVNAMDPSTRLQAARGGYEQGTALAEPLAAFWE